MHIAEGFLPPAHAVAWSVVAAPFVVHGARTAGRLVREHPETRLLLGAAGAFTFVLSALKLPSVSGSSSHPTGTGLGAIVVRPPVMALLGTIVLTLQALLLAHGGLTTLGANVVAMAVVGPWVGYVVWRLFARAPFLVAAFVAIAAADLATYLTTATQLALAFPDPGSGVLGSWVRFVGVFGVTQVPLAAVEGVVGALLLKVLVSWAGPELRTVGMRMPGGAPREPEDAQESARA